MTIATNMAGRGTDIVLGGAPAPAGADAGAAGAGLADEEWQKAHQQVVDAGGLHIIGTERHESRRIDNQLRGRSGRQGDPGSSRFYLSMGDNLMRIFAGDRMRAIMGRVGIEKGEAIEHGLVSRAIENAQRKVEAHNFDIRKTLLEYDDTANEQRQEVYAYRNELLETDSVHESMRETIAGVLEDEVNACIVPGMEEERWETAALEKTLEEQYGLNAPIREWMKDDADLERADILARATDAAMRLYDGGSTDESGRASADGAGDGLDWDALEKALLLHVLDRHWKEHLALMDHLRQGIGLRSFAQRNPKQEYKREAFGMFKTMMTRVDRDVVRHLLSVRAGKEIRDQLAASRQRAKMEFRHDEAADALHPQAAPLAMSPDGGMEKPRSSGNAPRLHEIRPRRKPVEVVRPQRRAHAKIKRNDPCFCGSGKKYKNCHGA